MGSGPWAQAVGGGGGKWRVPDTDAPTDHASVGRGLPTAVPSPIGVNENERDMPPPMERQAIAVLILGKDPLPGGFH